MFFFAKSLIAILLVCVALGWHARGSNLPLQERPTDSRASVSSRSASSGAQLLDKALEKGTELARSGANAIQSQAREKCLAQPQECMALVRRLNGANMRRLPQPGGANEKP